MRTIGTDVSLDVCRAEGYTMMQYDARKKFNPDEYYRVFQHLPEYIQEETNLGVGEKKIHRDHVATFNEMKEHYLENKDSLDSFAQTCDYVNFENPDYYDFLNLASDIMWYGGYFE